MFLGQVIGQKSQFFPSHVYLVPYLGVSPLAFHKGLWHKEPRFIWLSWALAAWMEYLPLW